MFSEETREKLIKLLLVMLISMKLKKQLDELKEEIVSEGLEGASC